MLTIRSSRTSGRSSAPPRAVFARACSPLPLAFTDWDTEGLPQRFGTEGCGRGSQLRSTRTSRAHPRRQRDRRRDRPTAGRGTPTGIRHQHQVATHSRLVRASPSARRRRQCGGELLEASKSVAQKIRDRTGLTGDAATLVDAAFTTKTNMPPLAFNRLEDSNELSERRGLATMLKGFFMTFRNPTAHSPKVSWAVHEAEALDMLAQASMFHRRLDDATVTPAAPVNRRHAP